MAPDPGAPTRHPWDLGSLLLLTDRQACSSRGRYVIGTVGLAVDAGAHTVVLREKDLPRADRLDLARQLRRVVPKLIVASDVDMAREVGADGVHLAASDPWPDASLSGAPSVGGPLLVGRSCHGRADVEQAADEGATYVTLSPVFPTTSKPGYGPALGPEALGGHPIGVFALGGIEPGLAGRCITAGAAGVAVMGAVMGAADPAGMVTSLLDEIDRAAPSAQLGDTARTERIDRWAPTGPFGHVGAHRSPGRRAT